MSSGADELVLATSPSLDSTAMAAAESFACEYNARDHMYNSVGHGDDVGPCGRC